MADTTNVAFSAEYTSVSVWSGTLQITLTNNTGAPLTSPVQISFDMPLTVTPTSNTGLIVQSSGVATNHVVGTLSDTLLPIADGASVTFNVGIGASGDLTADSLPTAYYVNDVEAGEGGGETTDTVAPSIPTNVQVTGTTSSTIDVAWDAATDNVGVAGYIVHYTNTAGSSTKRVVGADNTSTTLDGLSADTKYSIWVEAYDAAGNLSGSDSEIVAITQAVSTDTTAPSIPENLYSTNVTQNSISLAWDASTDDESGVNSYVVSYAAAGQSGQTVTVTSPTATITGLDPSTTYTFSVSALDNAGNQSANSASFTTSTLAPTDTTAPSAPTNVTVDDVTQNTASLSWDASTDAADVDHYLVTYTGSDGSSGSVTSNTTSATVTGLSSSTTYTFSVSAIDAANNQSNGSSASATTLAPPSTGGGGAVEFGPYVDVSIFADWSTSPLTMTTDFISDALALGVKKFRLAFLVKDPAGSNTPVWGNANFPLTSIKKVTDVINAAGAEPVFSYGGASGIDFSTSWSAADIAALYVSNYNTYGVKLVDLDFETASYYNYSVAFQAFLQARSSVPNLELGLTLRATPSGLDAAGVEMINAAAALSLYPYVNIMAMDYGEGTQGDMGEFAISAVTNTKNQVKAAYGLSDADAYAKVAVTPMIGQNDTAGEILYLDDAADIAAFAKANGLYEVSEWALARDFAPDTTDSHGKQHSSYDLATTTQIAGQEPYAFTKTLLNGIS